MAYQHGSGRGGNSRGTRGGQGGQRSNQTNRPFHKRRPSNGGGSRRGKSNHRGAYIHPSKFVNKATISGEETPYEPKHTFADFPFHPALHKNIAHKKYTTPSAIQDQSIPFTLEGRDVLGLANTGTGKTAAFLLPILNNLYSNPVPTSVLILAPTRELAQQIDEQFRDFSYGMKLFSTLLVGGANIDRQMKQLVRRPHVVIGTPGRVMDLIKRKKLNLGQINTVVLDEADRMLDMGFVNDIREIIGLTPNERQTLFFSATITPQIQKLMDEFLNNPEVISVRTADTSERVDQDIVIAATKEEKLEKLQDMLGKDEFEKVLLFGETKFGVQRLSDHLDNSGIPSAAIHGNKSQSQRQRALRAFKNDHVKVLVATDVAARGLDIPNVSHVINFDQPATYEDYVHRIGRTGRGTATGKALTFVPPHK
ncbi:DEAD/DEAH box helicase [Candidatus Saccharibacteria bacterium TM7i]|nr:DEAD/DEAH box helicase [Candidatus Saccharibacteria bacterium TM7i]